MVYCTKYVVWLDLDELLNIRQSSSPSGSPEYSSTVIKCSRSEISEIFLSWCTPKTWRETLPWMAGRTDLFRYFVTLNILRSSVTAK